MQRGSGTKSSPHELEYARAYHASHRDEARSLSREWYERNRQRKAAYDRIYRREHKEHRRAMDNAWKKRNRAHLAMQQRLRHYQFSRTAYEEMLAAQNGECAICFSQMAKPCIDHDHQSGRVRGLLCHGCNIKLVAVEEYGFVELARAYLTRQTKKEN